MLPLKAYLLHWLPDEGWDITVHRDFDSLIDACKLVPFEQDHTAVIHIGFWRPDADAFQEAVERFPGVVLVTSSAKDALPRPLETTAKPVCAVQGLGLFPILSGWGYQTTEADLGVATEWQRQMSFLGAPRTSIHMPLPFETSEVVEWVARLSYEFPQAYEAALSYGIQNDDALFSRELILPDKLHSFLNVYRFRFLTGELPTASNVLDRLHLAGPALLQAPLSNFELSVRATNVFNSASISHVHQIAEIRTQGLFRFKNMGKKTVTELATLMMNVWFPGYREGDRLTFEGIGESSVQAAISRVDEIPKPTKEIPGQSDGQPSGNFLELLRDVICHLANNRQSIVRNRMGLEGQPKTLEEIGKNLGISRERVRQIETVSIQILRRNQLFKDQLTPRLLSLLRDRQSPLSLFGLDVIDHWFSGVVEVPYTFKWILEHCCEATLSLINHNNQYFVTQLDQNKWDNMVLSTINLMESQVENRITKLEARSLVNGMLIGPGEELRDELWEEILSNLNFSGGDGDEAVLVNVGSSLASITEAVLVESPIPLHINVILERVTERSGRETDETRLRKILSESAFLFGRGIYGLRSHLDLTDEELDDLRMEAEEIINGAESQRQWHASEIYSFLVEYDPDLHSKITPHAIGIALKNSDLVVSLGRMVWTAKQAVINGSASRIDIHQAIVSLLQNEGRPMMAGEIKRRLLRDRGLNNIFQIVMEDPLIRVGRGVWGLFDRDTPYSGEEQIILVESLLVALKQRQRGIHYNILLRELSKYVRGIDLNVDPSLIQSIAIRSGLIKVDMSQYLYLPEWGNSRWPSSAEVVSQIVGGNPNGGWTAAEILEVAEFELERPLEPRFIHRAIEALGGIYNLDEKKWYFPAESTEQDSIE